MVSARPLHHSHHFPQILGRNSLRLCKPVLFLLTHAATKFSPHEGVLPVAGDTSVLSWGPAVPLIPPTLTTWDSSGRKIVPSSSFTHTIIYISIDSWVLILCDELKSNMPVYLHLLLTSHSQCSEALLVCMKVNQSNLHLWAHSFVP